MIAVRARVSDSARTSYPQAFLQVGGLTPARDNARALYCHSVVIQEGRGLLVLRIASGLSALSLLAWTFHGVNFARARDAVVGVGVLGLIVIAAPQLLSLVLRCIGWGYVFKRLGQRVACALFAPLLRGVRLMTEAVAQTLPLGYLVGITEAIAARSPRRNASGARAAPLPDGAGRASTCSCRRRRFTLRCSRLRLCHAAPAFLGAYWTRGVRVRGVWGERVLVLAGVWRLRGVHARPHRRSLARAAQYPGQRSLQARFASTTSLLHGYGSAHRAVFSASFVQSTALPGVFFLCGWLSESLEKLFNFAPARHSARFLRRGEHRGTALVLEERAVHLPAGIGVQDAGYVSCLAALGVADALTVGAAFHAKTRKRAVLGRVRLPAAGLGGTPGDGRGGDRRSASE